MLEILDTMTDPFSSKSNPDHSIHLPNVEKGVHSEIAHLHTPTTQEEPIVIPPRKKSLLTAENIAQISVILMILAIMSGVWAWSQLEARRSSEARRQGMVVDSLMQVKGNLETNLDQLETTFAGLTLERDTLAQQLASATNIIAEKETVIKEVKNQQVREETALRAQVQRLQTVKDRYEAIIAVLNQKNAALLAENARLHGTADSLSSQISDLGRQLESQVRRTMSAQYKATSFRVELARRNDKLTVRARRTRDLHISFELNDVPAMYQGNQQLYLVITDDKGLPIASKNPVQTMIRTEKGQVAIIAQATQAQNIIENQRIILDYSLEDRLKKGTYVVSVYSDHGLLGVAGFRLT